MSVRVHNGLLLLTDRHRQRQSRMNCVNGSANFFLVRFWGHIKIITRLLCDEVQAYWSLSCSNLSISIRISIHGVQTDHWQGKIRLKVAQLTKLTSPELVDQLQIVTCNFSSKRFVFALTAQAHVRFCKIKIWKQKKHNEKKKEKNRMQDGLFVWLFECVSIV